MNTSGKTSAKTYLLDSLHEPTDEQLRALMRRVGILVAARRQATMDKFWSDLAASARETRHV